MIFFHICGRDGVMCVNGHAEGGHIDSNSHGPFVGMENRKRRPRR